ncbi:MAG: hypothetical protein V2I54_09035 [Bacteroidales bacterium]|jgi:hypothetical protein|nr:hypothetical protein [Bacteroidales bacterium]
MKKYLFLFLLFTPLFSLAQIIDNQLDIQVGFVYNSFYGEEEIRENDFIFPSVYNNMENHSGYSVRASYKFKPMLSLGLGLSASHLSGWDDEHYPLFSPSSLTNFLFLPLAKFHTPFYESGIFNRLKLLVEVSPHIGVSHIAWEQPLFVIESETGTMNGPMEQNDLIWGVQGSVGIEFTLWQDAGVFCNYGVSQHWVDSKLYNDSSAFSSFIEAGMVLKLYPNKHFYY